MQFILNEMNIIATENILDVGSNRKHWSWRALASLDRYPEKNEWLRHCELIFLSKSCFKCNFVCLIHLDNLAS